MKSKRIYLLFLIHLFCLKNATSEENKDGNFLVVSTSPSPATQKYSKLEEKLSKVEQSLEFLTALKKNDLSEEQNSQIKKLLKKQITCENSSKQIVKLLEETKEKQVQQDKTLAELSKKLEGYDSAVDSFRDQIEAMKQQILSKLESNELVLNKMVERQEKTELEISKIKEDLSLPKDCKDVQYKKSASSGVYGIQPANAPKPFMVWCDMETRGGGWVHVLNRFDGSVDFSLNWTDYKQGFGNLGGELWMGLEHLYELTSSEPNELLVELSDWNDRKGYAIYSHFEIGNEGEGYMFKNKGIYSGTAGDSMSYSYGQKFSTVDNDQDEATGHCAEWHGGWWYKNCFHAKLTGKYFNGTVVQNEGLHWKTFAHLDVSLKTAKMMIRPIK